MHGLRVHGLRVHGPRVHGLRVQGLRVQGLRVCGLRACGLKFHGLRVHGLLQRLLLWLGGSRRGTTSISTTGEMFLGATKEAALATGRVAYSKRVALSAHKVLLFHKRLEDPQFLLVGSGGGFGLDHDDETCDGVLVERFEFL